MSGSAVTSARAADDLPIVGDIPMPEVNVDVRLGDDDLPPAPRGRFVYPRRPFADVPLARFEPIDESSVPPFQVARMLRSTGFSLLGPINRRGWVYTVAVLNPRGDDGRAVIDARTGAIIRFIPAGAVDPQELAVIYGPSGPPPQPVRDVTRGPRPPRPVPHAANRTVPPKVAAPKVAAAKPAQAPKLAQGKPADAHAEMTTASAPKSDAAPAKSPEVKLWPTMAMPDVQTFE